ncbi:UNVERIFIED_CONTAM: hypothetical protein PYX00_010473 [Menopon gallinae]|uniref:Peptidase S1 domain-containing protein n=1 Tax=Menopon gallinae TaxID=328185 RepID=A0AAW2HFQ9_9NEOP
MEPNHQYTDIADCGRSSIGYRQPRNWSEPYEGRIINGKQSLRGAWPWQVSLQLLHPKFGLIGHWCGAVLIQPLWILTAAHCIHNDLFNLPLASLWTAVLGEWDRNVEESTEIRVPIDKIIVHERFHNYQNDIAIMRLSKAVPLRTICLPEEITKYNLYPEISKTFDPMPSDKMFYNLGSASQNVSTNRKGKEIRNSGHKYEGNRFGWLSDQIRRISEKFQGSKKAPNVHSKYREKSTTECVATGWGRHNAHGPLTSTLLQATVPLHDNSLCQAKYGNSIPIQTGHLCAGRLDGTTGTCVGDSGGPLQCSLTDGRWVLAGLTSFGSGCAKPGYPDVYTRLAYYVPWINNQISSNTDDFDED